MILTVFRSRLNAGIDAEYAQQVDNTASRVEDMPGFVAHKLFVAEDGERLTLVEFESMEAQRAWSLSAEHRQAAIAGRKRFYSEYKIQICTVMRQSDFLAAAGPATVAAMQEAA